MGEFTLASFAAHLAHLAIDLEIEEHHALYRSGQIVQKEAKEELGVYQQAAGQFPAWAQLAPSTQAQRVDQGYTPNDPGLRSGQMRDSIELTVVDKTAYIGSDDQNLVYFEEGTVRQPPRHVLAGSLFRKANEIVQEIGSDITGYLSGQSGNTPIR